MNKNRIFAIFILFALLITCAGVSFASSDIDDYSIGDDIDDYSIDDDLEISDDDISDDDDWDDDDYLGDEDDWDDEDDLDDEDWDDCDDDDDLDDDDWDDWDDDDYLDDEDWDEEDWEYYYDNLDFIDDWEYYDDAYYLDDGDYNDTNGTLKIRKLSRMLYYTASKGYATSAARYNSNDYNSTDEEYNETEECNETFYMIEKMVLGASFVPTCQSGDIASADNQSHDVLIENTDYDFDSYQSVADEKNTSESNEKQVVSKNIIQLNNGSENNILALLFALIISILLLL